MRKTLLFFFLLLSVAGFAQRRSLGVNGFSVSAGEYNIISYTNNIIKVTFYPKEYTKGENISDAVVLAPINYRNTHPLKLSGDTLMFIRDSLKIFYHQYKDGKGFGFLLKNGEMIFGGGERALPLNRRGYRLNLYNNPWYGYGEGADNLNYSVPFIT